MQTIPGLTVIDEFVSPEEEIYLVKCCDERVWSGFGIRYNVGKHILCKENNSFPALNP
jgi:hypothetical protein